MNIVVRKYGGSSLSTVQKIRTIAKSNADWCRENRDKKLLLVVSAMGDTTDELKEMAGKITANPNPRELDMLLTAGERISMALMAIALADHGQSAVSFTGSQAGINTESRHNSSRVVRIQADRVIGCLHRNNVAIVAGFQGVSPTRDVTTLGRGGSDTTAVALACAIGAERCEICTDVDGVMSSDPRLIGERSIIPFTDYDSLLDMAHFGAKVIHPRAVELARKFGIELEIRNSFNTSPGTVVKKGVADTMERSRIEAVNSRKDIVFFSGYTDNWRDLLAGLRLSRINVMNPVVEYADDRVKYSFWTCKDEWNKAAEDTLKISPETNLGILAVTGFELSSDVHILEDLQKMIQQRSKIRQLFSTGQSYVFIVPQDGLEELVHNIFERYLKK